MSTIKNMLLLLVVSLIFTAQGFAHGVHYQKFNGGVGIQVTYQDEEPMRHAEIKVFAPSDRKKIFQAGITDVT